jgi:hypothetical protein
MLSIPEILDTVRADFEARGIDGEVIFGGWRKDYFGLNRIVVGLADFELEQPGLPGAPGVHLLDAQGDEERGHGARALFTRRQTLRVWISTTPPGDRDPKRSENAQKATAARLHQFLRALYVACHGSLVAGRGTWTRDDDQPFVYGSLVELSPEISIPVFDDLMPAVAVDAEGSTLTTASVDASGEEEIVAVTPAV